MSTSETQSERKSEGKSTGEVKSKESGEQKKDDLYLPFPKLKLIKPKEYLKGKNPQVEIIKLREINMKYNAMKNFLEKRKEKTEQKIDELNESILVVRSVEKRQKMERENINENKKGLELFMPLEETLYVKGEMNPAHTIYIWLGANVMVELEFDEALNLLNSHLDRAHSIYKQMVEESEYMRKQVEIANANLAAVIFYLDRNKREKLIKQKNINLDQTKQADQ